MKNTSPVIHGLNHTQTVNANKMIAGFMGLTIVPCGIKVNGLYIEAAPEGCIYEDMVSYDESWDNLMPVYLKMIKEYSLPSSHTELSGIGMFGVLDIWRELNAIFSPENSKGWTSDHYLNHAYKTIVSILKRIDTNKQKQLAISHK